MNSESTLATFGGLALVASAFFGPPAYAESASPTEPEPDQIIYVDGPLPEVDSSAEIVQSDANTEVRIVEQEDLPAVPAPGETIRIVYNDGVTEITTEPTSEVSSRAAAACTKTISAEQPTKTNAGSASSRGRGSISSGCGSAETLRVYLYTGIEVKADSSITVPNNGSSFGITAAKSCGNSDSTSHYTLATWSGGGSAQSKAVNLKCGYGFWG